jgi:AraC-like DNA-binding protein
LQQNKLKYIFVFFLLFQITGTAQELLEKKHFLTNEIVESISSNPNQAIKIAQHLLSKPSISNDEKAKINFLLAKIYCVKGDYSSALNFLYQQKDFKNLLSIYEEFNVELLKSSIYRELDLDKQSDDKLLKIEADFFKLAPSETKKAIEIAIVIQKAKALTKKKQFDKAIKLLLSCKVDTKLNDKFDDTLNLWYTLVLADLYTNKKDFNRALTLYQSAIEKTATYKRHNAHARLFAQLGLAKIATFNKDFVKTDLLLNNALNSAEVFQNLQLKSFILNKLSDNYLALSSYDKYKTAALNFIEVNEAIEGTDQEALNTAYNLISQEIQDEYDAKKQTYYNVIYALLIFLLLFLVFLSLLTVRSNQQKSRLAEIIKYLKITKRNFLTQTSETHKQDPKKITIPKETEQLLLSKLKKFEKTTKFTNKDISLAVLAGQFDTNTKYLSEVINSNYNINFNTYINRLRINYIVQKLKTEPNYKSYKISYLAENSGFSSHSSFATVFKTITGISPVTFIELLKSENQTNS